MKLQEKHQSQYSPPAALCALPSLMVWTDLSEGRCYLLCKTIDGLEENNVDKIVEL